MLTINTANRHFASLAETYFLSNAAELGNVRPLASADQTEVLDFLAIRPVHTVVMTGFINDNGIESSLNRGRFFGHFSINGKLDGVALIGHSTIVEARSEAALRGLAAQAQKAETPIHLIMSAGDDAEKFWDHYTNGLTQPRLRCEELLFEIGFPFPVPTCEWEIRTATAAELIEVAEAQAEVAELECGVNPMEKDREGFLKRVLRRIEQGRVFVAYDGDKMVFKADIIAENNNVAYLEGVYAAKEYRGRGIGSRCLASLSLDLLSRAEKICLLSNVAFEGAHRSFAKAGYRQTDKCITLFV